MSTYKVVDTLLKFLDLPNHTLIYKFIREHTQENAISNNPNYQTAKNSKNIAFAWRNKLSNEEIRKVQQLCIEPMNKLGYIPMKNIPIYKLDPSYQLMAESHLGFQL